MRIKDIRFILRKLYFTFTVLLLICVANSSFAISNIPKFKVISQDFTSLTILVPSHTTKEQIKALIYEFRNARKGNYLSKMIPATTGGGQLGDYAIVWILVFSEEDAEWASKDKLKRFMKSSLKNPMDKKYDKEYVKHIKAEYYYSTLEEHGNLGYDDGIIRSTNYQKLF